MLASAPAAALDAEPAPSAEPANSAARPSELPPLPKPPPLELPKPDPKQLAALDNVLASLAHAETREPSEALPPPDARLVAAIAFRLGAIAERADKAAMKALLLEIRKKARAGKRGDDGDDDDEPAGARKAGAADSPTADYFAMLLSDPRTEARAYADLIGVVGMSRMLTRIGSVEAARTLIQIYVRFGEFLRVHTQRELASLGERAIPALIEARRHPAEKIGKWAARQLDALGRAVPSEAVRAQDPQVLADVLRAYGRTRDPNALRIIVSFANSERAVVREAARQAVALLGEVALWQLRDSYENVVGEKPPRDWTWERAARELFREFDRLRAAPLADAFRIGREAKARGDLEAMRAAFDEVLARDPRFDERRELGEGYAAYARAHLDDHPERALDALGRAERLMPEGAERDRLKSLALALRAEHGIRAGVADTTLLTRALELDADNRRARALLEAVRRGKADESSERSRRLVAGSVALGALAAVVVLLRRRSSEPKPRTTASS